MSLQIPKSTVNFAEEVAEPLTGTVHLSSEVRKPHSCLNLSMKGNDCPSDAISSSKGVHPPQNVQAVQGESFPAQICQEDVNCGKVHAVDYTVPVPLISVEALTDIDEVQRHIAAVELQIAHARAHGEHGFADTQTDHLCNLQAWLRELEHEHGHEEHDAMDPWGRDPVSDDYGVPLFTDDVDEVA